MTSIPDSVYVVIGALVLTNLSAVVSAIRGVWYLAKLDSRVSEIEKDLNEAFRMIKQNQEE